MAGAWQLSAEWQYGHSHGGAGVQQNPSSRVIAGSGTPVFISVDSADHSEQYALRRRQRKTLMVFG
jgi:hypothetical protein